jgi:predicted O-methyltransferase YrrM
MNHKRLIELYQNTHIPTYDNLRDDSTHHQLLYTFVRFLNPKFCVEIGSRKGWSSAWIAQGLKDNGKGRLVCIDCFIGVGKGMKSQFLQTILDLRFEKIVHLIEKPSQDVVDMITDPIDFLFIDGAHEYEPCKRDIDNYVPKLSIGGTVLLHDYRPCKGVKEAIADTDWTGFFEIPIPTWNYGLWAAIKE